ncbi:hypothetical protein HPB47_008762, partial [Ixodes persulcatus]
TAGMCLLYLFVNPQPKPDEYLLVLANVRDEFFGRPTSGCHVWERNPQLVGRESGPHVSVFHVSLDIGTD